MTFASRLTMKHSVFSAWKWAALLLLACALAAGCMSFRRHIIQKYPDSILLSDEDADLICQAAWDALQRGDPASRLRGRVLRDDQRRTLFLSASDGSRPAVVTIGQGHGFAGALRDAAARMRERLNAAAGSSRKRKPTWLKVDIVQGKDDVRNIMQSGPTVPRRRLMGIALDWETRLALLPEEVAVHDLVTESAVPRLDRVERYFKQRGASAAQVVRIKKQMFGTPGFFRSASFFYDGSRTVRLHRGHRMWQTVHRDELLEAAKAAGAYLTRSVREDGSFVYIYLAAEDNVPDDYNLVRHAGTVYSMLDLYATTGDTELLAAASRAIEYLVSSAHPCGGEYQELACIWEGEGLVQLGASALGLLSLATYEKATGDTQHHSLAVKVGNYIVDSVRDDGSLMCSRVFATGEDTDITSPYYPGEAIFALARLYGIDPKEKWLDAAEKAAARLTDDTPWDDPKANIEHDHWQMYALNELDQFRPHPRYVEQSLRLAHEIRAAQHRAHKPPLRPIAPDWPGGYYAPPRATPTATRSEGLLAAYQLLRRHDRNKDAAEVMDTAVLGVTFQLQCQVRPETAMYLPDPQRCLGGVRCSLTAFEMRNDYSQHFISSVLSLYRILLEEAIQEPQADEAKRWLKHHRKAAFPWRR